MTHLQNGGPPVALPAGDQRLSGGQILDEDKEYVDNRAPGSFHIPVDTVEEGVMSWSYICTVLSHGDLDQLMRHKRCDDAYRAWAPPVKAKYGGLENYIRTVRLGWPAEAYTGPPLPNMLDKPQRPQAHLAASSLDKTIVASAPGTPGTHTPVLEKTLKETWPEKTLPHPLNPSVTLRYFTHELLGHPEYVKCIPNDWPYGIPPDCTHWVVWSKLPIIHPSVFEETDSPFKPKTLQDRLYKAVTGDGVRGFTGFIPKDTGPTYSFQNVQIPEILGDVSRSFIENPTSTTDESQHNQEQLTSPRLTPELISQAHHWAGQHIRQYIHKKWPPHKYITAWFCNPPGLRTVPGLSHFHVIVKKRSSPPPPSSLHT